MNQILKDISDHSKPYHIGHLGGGWRSDLLTIISTAYQILPVRLCDGRSIKSANMISNTWSFSSRNVVSSSNRSTLHASAKAPAMATLCFWPPLSVWTDLWGTRIRNFQTKFCTSLQLPNLINYKYRYGLPEGSWTCQLHSVLPKPLI